MHNTAIKKNEAVVTGKLDISKIAKGHQPHRSGAGIHQHRATKRVRTRSQQRQAAFQEWK